MEVIYSHFCMVYLDVVNHVIGIYGLGSIGGFSLFAVGGARSPHPAVPFQWLHPQHACEYFYIACIRTAQ